MANFAALLSALSNLPQFSDNPLTPGFNPNAPPPIPALPAPTFTPDTSSLPMELAGPTAPPPTPAMPLNADILRQYLALAGPAPTPPPQQKLSPGELLSLVFQNIGAGAQGQGQQFNAQLRAQQEAPQREYQQQLAEYNQQKQRFGLAGINAAQSAEERRQDRGNRMAENQFKRDYDEFVRRGNFTDEIAKMKLADALQTERQAKVQADIDERQRLAKEAANNKQRAQIKKSFLDQLKGSDRQYADELASYAMNEIDQLSPGAQKAYSVAQGKAEAQIQHLQRITTSRGAGAPKTPPTQAVLENGMTVPANLVDKKLGTVSIGGKILNVTGYTGKGTAPAPTGGAQESPARAKYRAAAKAEGHGDAEITDYLNKHGIK